jgi:iron(III) transport system substrate-binding protein
MRNRIILPLLLALAATGCAGRATRAPEQARLRIYTSLYEDVISALEKSLKAKYPDVKIEWTRASSEIIAAKVYGEFAEGGVQADLLMTSDPFWYEDIKEKHLLLAYDTPAVARVPKEYKDPDHCWAAVRVPAVTLAYNPRVFAKGKAPISFKELATRKFRGKVTFADPSESGTSLAAIAMLTRRYGWRYVKDLHANNALALGNSREVLKRITSGKRAVGFIQIGNVLKAQQGGKHIAAVNPAEGIIPVPSPAAIVATTTRPELAKKVYDFMFSKEAQDIIVAGYTHSPFVDRAAPKGAAPLARAVKKDFAYTAVAADQIRAERDSTKMQFARIMAGKK